MSIPSAEARLRHRCSSFDSRDRQEAERRGRQLQLQLVGPRSAARFAPNNVRFATGRPIAAQNAIGTEWSHAWTRRAHRQPQWQLGARGSWHTDDGMVGVREKKYTNSSSSPSTDLQA